MRNIWVLLLAVVFGLSFGVGSASADTLHGFCTGCFNNGTSLQVNNQSPDFGFTKAGGSEGNTGQYWVDFLVPNTGSNNTLTFNVTGTQGGAANNLAISATSFLVNPSDTNGWTSGNLGAFIGGIFANPSSNNPIGAFLPSTQTIVPSATGYFVYQTNLLTTAGNIISTLHPNANPGSGPQLHVNGLPFGSFIVGFFRATGSEQMVGTPNSSAIFVPEPASLLLLGSGLAGIGLWRVRKQR